MHKFLSLTIGRFPIRKLDPYKIIEQDFETFCQDWVVEWEKYLGNF